MPDSQTGRSVPEGEVRRVRLSASEGLPPLAENEVRDEILQARSLGWDTSSHEERLRNSKDDPSALLELYEELLALGAPEGFSYEEPSGLEEIRAVRPKPRGKLKRPAGDELRDRMLGAWIGRIAGCLVGKPVEGWSYERIRETLEKAGEWPLSGYFPDVGVEKMPKNCLRGNITRAPRDDDTDYTVLGLHLVESEGYSFSTEDVARAWLQLLPCHKTYTAERAAYRNVVMGLEPPHTATFRNPYREWIGAEIRADGFGYCSAGEPELAAELAWRDARLSHVSNGIYGEMLFAAAAAAGPCVESAEEALLHGLAQIPENSRLAEAVRETIKWSKEDSSWEETRLKVMERWGELHRVHTINNAALVVMGLMHAGGEFSKAVTIAVMGGLDTDCNGATAGSVMGGIVGAKALDDWAEPLNDTLETGLFGFGTVKITELAERTLKLLEQRA